MSFFFRILIFTSVFGLCACTTPHRSTTNSSPAASPDGSSAAQCAQQGGALKKVGRLQREVCAIPYADAGKICRDDTDCTGICKTDQPVQPGQATTGQCQLDQHDKFGCYTEIDNGKAGATICVD